MCKIRRKGVLICACYIKAQAGLYLPKNLNPCFHKGKVKTQKRIHDEISVSRDVGKTVSDCTLLGLGLSTRGSDDRLQVAGVSSRLAFMDARVTLTGVDI